MNKRIIIYQQELLGKIPQNDYKIIKSHKTDFLALPEYFFHPEVINYDEAINYMKKISNDLGCILIGGTTVLEKKGKKYNCCYLYNKGKQIGHYCKINLFEKELGRITPGNEYKIFEVEAIKIGILICADVLYEESWQKLKELQPDIIFIPTFSPYKNESIEDKYKRDKEIFIKGAKITNSTVVKICGIGTYNETKIQGRSLVCDKNSIIWRVSPDNEDDKIIKISKLDF